jgi:hypothetical protein
LTSAAGLSVFGGLGVASFGGLGIASFLIEFDQLLLRFQARQQQSDGLVSF